MVRPQWEPLIVKALRVTLAIFGSFLAGLLYAWILQARVTRATVEQILTTFNLGPANPGRSDITRTPSGRSTEERTMDGRDERSLMDRLEADGEIHWKPGA